MKLIKSLLLVIFAIASVSANAQELKKKVLAVGDFTYSRSSFTSEDASLVRNQIIKAVQNTGRVIVVDQSSSTQSELYAEGERRKQESAMDANEVADMISLNSNSILAVNLDQLSVTKETYEDVEYYKDSEGKTRKRVKGRYPYLLGVFTYTVKITDCETGMVQAQRTFSITDGGVQGETFQSKYKTADEVREALVRKCVNEDEFKVLILNTFKPEGKILQVNEGTPKKAKTVYVSLGSDDGIEVKQILEVYKEIDIAGEISKRLIGEAEIIEIMGPSRCLIKIKNCGEEVQQVLSSGGVLIVQTRDVKLKFFGGVK
jgi:hypothetical protein